MNNGWIKLHRQFLKWEWSTNPDTVSFFIYCLLKANHEDSRWQDIEIKRGQFITGINTIAKETGISAQSVRTCIKRLKSTCEITSKSTNKYSIITVCKYDNYQQKENTTNKDINKQTNKQLTNNQQTTNHKQEAKEAKNIINNTKKSITNNNTIDSIINNTIDWTKNFLIYSNNTKEAFRALEQDKDYIAKLQGFYPIYNIIQSIRKGYSGYWGKEAGWRNKIKAAKKAIKEHGSYVIDWKTTILNTLEKSRVFYTKDELNKMQ